MLLSDLIEETYSALIANKVRSLLTILGIIIGIGSVVAMISIGEGAKKNIEQSIQSIGSNLVMIYPGSQRKAGNQVRGGFGSAQTLTQDDAEAILSQVNNVDYVASEISRRYQVTFKANNTNVSVAGVTSEYNIVKNIEIETGTFISKQQNENLSKVAVIGFSTNEELFGENVDSVGKKIRINQITFTVIGVMQEKGGTGFGSQDDIIYIPLNTAQKFLTGGDYVSTINVQVHDQKLMSLVEEDITDLLLTRHNIANADLADFSILNQNDIVDTASSVTNTFTVLLSAIASISLIVGGIGIMNMMLTNVAERTNEIGLRKSIGAKNQDINYQFLAESTILTITGGILGIVFG
ncbi:MAG TPA: ABC transporter permease [Candidatus Paceibacterota bacterium]|jgi:putative ABC transport system permease protein|nr:ABC transporter permease [Candidatus Paceibacterota bacterium]HRZ29722.1 ABC transporter permease [Candidatus Paceibacterota bacterium]